MKISPAVLSMALWLCCVPVAANAAVPALLAQEETPGPLAPPQPPAQQHNGFPPGSIAPKRISGQPPIYPPDAKAKGLEGSVTLHATIDTDGNVGNISVVSATDPIFVDAAITALKSWKFSPYLRDGVPVAVQTNITVNFTIKK
ncbi:MAG: energy transducer TonB [Acidobacteriaceae bacterium]|jgi:TonB family protein